MYVIDAHCDALMKLFEDETRSFTNNNEIDTNFERLQIGKVKVQLFTIFVEADVPFDQKYIQAKRQMELFEQKIIAKHSLMRKINKWEDIFTLKENEIGAVLTLEGADVFGNDFLKLHELYECGVRSIGLTWNNANLVGDGIGESRGAGLTDFGKEVVKRNNENKVLTDVSHLSVNGFWDAIEIANFPIASHSNSRTICDHLRNVYDDQAKALFAKKGIIGLAFYPPFLTNNDQATITDILRHIDYLCSIGGENYVCFGSDFDGITKFVKGLENASQYQHLINELLKHYRYEQVKKFAYGNFLQFIEEVVIGSS